MRIIVIGGGITGLAAAFELAQQQAAFVLLESSSRLGGLIRTEHLDGFTIEAGPDSMLAQKPAALDLCHELGLGPRLISTTLPRTAYVLKAGSLYALPSPSVLGIPTSWRGLAAYDLLAWQARLRLGLEPMVRRARSGDDESVGSFFRRRFGRSTVDLVAEPLLGGIHAGDIEALSIKSLFPRFVEAESRRGSVLRSFRRTHPRPSGGGLFRSLSSGMAELVAAIERRLPDGAVRIGLPATLIERASEGWRVSTTAGVLEARALVFAAPAHVATSVFAPLDSELSTLCGEVPYVSTASVAVAWPRAAIRHPLGGSGFVVARRHSDLRITACTWVSSKWPGRAPAGMVLLRAFIGGASDPDAVNLDDDALVDVAVRDMSNVLGIEGPPRLARVFRWRNAGAQHNVGQLARMQQIESRLAQWPGLYVAGSGFRSIGIPDCVADGRAAADAALRYARMTG